MAKVHYWEAGTKKWLWNNWSIINSLTLIFADYFSTDQLIVSSKHHRRKWITVSSSNGLWRDVMAVITSHLTDTFRKKKLLIFIIWTCQFMCSNIRWLQVTSHSDFPRPPKKLYFFWGCRQTQSRHATDTCTPCTLLQTRHSCVLGQNTCQMIPGVRFSMTDTAHHCAPVIFYMARG